MCSKFKVIGLIVTVFLLLVFLFNFAYGNPLLEVIPEKVIGVLELKDAELRKLQLSFADVVITPKVGRFHWSDFSKPEQCVREGEIAAQNAILELKKKMKRVKLNWWKRLFY